MTVGDPMQPANHAYQEYKRLVTQLGAEQKQALQQLVQRLEQKKIDQILGQIEQMWYGY